ncbi:integrin alpha-8 [Sarcophilus harrisii]
MARGGPGSPRRAPLWGFWTALGMLCSPASQAFNLDVDKLTVYSGPEGSYFGYAVDFHIPDPRTVSILVGAPKANTSQPDIAEGGAVYYCPWPATGDVQCKQIPFDTTNNRKIRVNGTKEPIEFKSKQWFGATVKAHKGKVVACAPLYHWRTLKATPEKDPVGTCYVAIQNFSAYAEYSPCRNKILAGVPRGAQNFGYVSIINSTDMTFIQNFTGEQMASYFGYAISVSDVNNDGLDDVLVGAPLFMEREFESSPKEVGQVYLYLQESPLLFRDAQILSGTEVFGRFGSAITHLGDLNQDGYNDIAVGAPFAGEDGRGKVFIYNGNAEGLNHKPSQILNGAWASQTVPSGFGFTLRGDSDIDKNDYPDLIVGAFGTGKVIVYRARPVVTVDAQLLLYPVIINLENKTCQIPGLTALVPCFTLRVCASVEGQSISNTVALIAEVQLDSLKQKGAIKRTLFRDNHQPQLVFSLLINQHQSLQCHDFIIYLRDETEFRDKLSPINISLNYSLDESTFEDGLAVKPILNFYRESIVNEQAHILVDCGDDNMCIPDLKLSARSDKQQLIIGDENHLMLLVNARNGGEGAYEAELFVEIPEEADYIGTERNNKALHPLSCEYKMDNVSRMVVCDLGNPMVAGTNYSLGLRFAVPRLENTNTSIDFDLQIRSSNKDNPDSNSVSLQINVSAMAQVEIRGVSHPPQIVLPIHNWEPEEEPHKEEEVGPLVQHIYELHNIGPSTISETLLTVGWPNSARDESLLYIFHIQTLGPLQCRTNPAINSLGIKPAASQEDTPALSAFLRNSSIPHLVRKRHVPVVEIHRQSPAKILNCTNIECLRISCVVGRLEGGESAVLKVRARLWAQTFLQRKNDPYSLASIVSFEVKKMPYNDQPAQLPEGKVAIRTSVIWATPNVSFSIPLWVIILAILLGLLVLTLLTLALWKCGFFDRARPPQDDMADREQLTNDKVPDA